MTLDAQTIVVGGGTCGSAIAGRLAAAGFDVMLIEAGPDFGAFGSEMWPTALLDPCVMPVDLNSWGYTNSGLHGESNVDLPRARVLGGCSSHNGCAVVWGHHSDYDRWETAGNQGWGARDFAPYLKTASEQLGVVTPTADEVTPFHRAVLAASPAAGIPVISGFDSLEPVHGIGIGPVNITQRNRWNSAFAYLDPVRDRPNLNILADTIVDRVLLNSAGVAGVKVIGPGGARELRSERVVLAAGAYGSPLILQRSGIGDPTDLEAAGVNVIHTLPGVGKNLQDHPALALGFSGSDQLTDELEAFVTAGGLPREEGTVALVSSQRCDRAFDLHIYPIAKRVQTGDWQVKLNAALMASKSRGSIRLTSADPEAMPQIDHGYLSDNAGYDLGALVDSIAILRHLAGAEPLSTLIGSETGYYVGHDDPASLAEIVLQHAEHDYHPTSTCKMGRKFDPMAVVNQGGAVYGIDGLWIGDASIMPSVPMANTNLPALALAEKIVAGLKLVVKA